MVTSFPFALVQGKCDQEREIMGTAVGANSPGFTQLHYTLTEQQPVHINQLESSRSLRYQLRYFTCSVQNNPSPINI